MDGNIWRLSDLGGKVVSPSCYMNDLGSGILVSRDTPHPVMYADNINFMSYCADKHPLYMASTFKGIRATYLPMIMRDWAEYVATKNKMGRSFSSSVYPLLMSFSANFVITICLTVLAFIIVRARPHFWASTCLRLGSLISSINLLVSLIDMMNTLKNQHEHFGVSDPVAVLTDLGMDATFITLHFIAMVILQICQVCIVMRTFERNQEKRIILFCGLILVVATNVLWVTPQFTTVISHDTVNWELLPSFVYLFRIVIASSFACLIITDIISERRFWIKDLQMASITLLTVIATLLLPGFFIADVANVWIAELGEVFTTTCYVGSTFMAWEWLERIILLKRAEQAQSILGRPIFEDEQQNYNFARYALRVQDAIHREEGSSSSMSERTTSNKRHYEYGINKSSHTNNNNDNSSDEDDFYNRTDFQYIHPTSFNKKKSNVTSREVMLQNSSESESINQINFNTKQRYRDVFKQKAIRAYDNFIYFTDQVVLKKLGSNSLNSGIHGHGSSSNSDKHQKRVVRRRIGLDKPNETYVYTTKDVVFASDDEDDYEDESGENDDDDGDESYDAVKGLQGPSDSPTHRF